ncbi:MAG: Fe-S-cluster oxidoreductase [Candidatus Accumulibacter sp.]|nr:Fe-S-cluster oxidoreductase [Accumulibacter sp.]
MPGHPFGKPAGQPCVHLDVDYRCSLWGRPERPSFCAGLRASVDMCGNDRQQALVWLTALERTTQP